MAYRFDSYDNALVVDGFEKGIADNPFDGISDMRNCNIVSVPGEASVNFSTVINSSPTITGTKTVTGVAGNAISFTGITGLENGMSIQFTNVGSLTGVSLNTTYWVQSATGSPTTSIKLFSNFLQTSAVAIAGTAGGATFIIINIGNNAVSTGLPVYFTYDSISSKYYMQDGLGQVWTNAKTTTSGFWEYTGLSGSSDNTGCGLVFYKASDNTGYIFSWLSDSIDFFSLTSGTWSWGWNPADGTINNAFGYLHAVGGLGSPHEAIVAPDSKVYYCDGNWLCLFFQLDPDTPFVPTTKSTYTFTPVKSLIPVTDRAMCLSYIGTNILIGGQNNIVYSWDGFSTGAIWILLPEFNVHRMVTVNTNTFVFVGNRGRIYVTNGTNAQLYKKVPDHISGTVEPYFSWGGACSVKNQLYFSLLATTNSGSAISQYGGVWAIDMDTEAIRLTNKLSYGTYAGYSSAMIPNFASNAAGTGLWIGWDNGSNVYGIDGTSSSPYTGSQATIDSDLIPIGTFNKPKDMTIVEYKLTKPMVNSESVVIKTRLIFNTTDTGYTTTLSDSTIGHFSGTNAINFRQAQWVQFQIVVNSTATNPSYTRFKQLRILGLTGSSAAQAPVLDIGN